MDDRLVVRRVAEDDWALLRTVRLEMLADTPSAYLETVADAEARTEQEWRFRARRGSAGGTNLAGVRTLHLYVHEDNARARAFYRRHGFAETGDSLPYELIPSELDLEMDLSLVD